MALGRGSCMGALIIGFLILETVASTTHIVGDLGGWGFSISYTDWADDRSFAAGDTLVFNYAAGQHNVVVANAAAYKSCKSLEDLSQVQSTGNDKFTLKKGANYFLCSFPNHCAAGMKLRVIAK